MFPSRADTFCFDRTWVFPVAPAELWAVLSEPARFPDWWPWLRQFEGEGLVEGTRNFCVVRAPIPYTLRFWVEVARLVPERLVDARVTGDLDGPARLELSPHAGGVSARLTWDVGLTRPALRAAARVARPVMEWGHAWVVNNGAQQFRRRALRV